MAAAPTCAESVDPAGCDTDDDRIRDVVEKRVCGTSTCATGREDADRDGIPDWSELLVCGSVRCAEPGADADRDGIPDFAELFVCGDVSCSTGREDRDGDTFADWAEFVICGDGYCANGREDYDADGVSDAQQLAACVVAFDVTGPARWVRPPVSGVWAPSGLRVEVIWWPLIAGGILALAGFTFFGIAVGRQRARDRDAGADEVGSADLDELLGLTR